jgi:hypothetical protein
MLSTGKDISVTEKAEENLKTFIKVATGEEEFKFASETISKDLGRNILTNRRFLQEKVTNADTKCKEDEICKKINTLAHVELYTSQRSINYAYSERKKLFEAGWDSKLGEEYRAGLTDNTLELLRADQE